MNYMVVMNRAMAQHSSAYQQEISNFNMNDEELAAMQLNVMVESINENYINSKVELMRFRRSYEISLENDGVNQAIRQLGLLRRERQPTLGDLILSPPTQRRRLNNVPNDLIFPNDPYQAAAQERAITEAIQINGLIIPDT